MKGKDSFKVMPSWKGKGKGDGKSKGGKQFQQQEPPQANIAQTASSSASQAPKNKKQPMPKKAGVMNMIMRFLSATAHIPHNAYHHTKNAYQKCISNYYLKYKCLSTMSLTCDHHYCQPVSTCFSSAIFTQPDTTEGISVELG